MAHYDFKKDITVGEMGETIIVKDLESVGAQFISDNKDNKFDILMETPKGPQKYEIKTDVFCKPDRDTGNLFIEYECRGKTSGFEVTEAEWFVTLFPYLREAWYIKTDDLRELIKNNNFKTVQFSGDANSNTKGYLIKRNLFKESFTVRDIPKEWLNQF